ncbi:hypothetical protein DPM19_26125 [Actinomadura craniellae]|uniref:YfhO family protein n=1 Tax=Actinomadura craniellae TaxID=2231787 RepID=A0A365GZF2_9ACTN|nr:hypothetical protein [Actinomadura craniellae]RAY12202.1 hypothetical protein DPM19_26125 [Actinomadura craniellae]
MSGRARPAREHAPAAATGLLLGLLALGPGLAPGFVLSYDMVFAPDPAFTRMTFGLTGTLPRHVPSDAFVTALATVLPAALVQKLVLLAIFVLACTAAASLVPSRRLLPRLAAGACYAWNPFVAERLLLGHWALLLGYAALPWVVAAAARRDSRRLILALLPAAVGGFAAMTVSALAVLAVTAASGPERGRALLRAAGPLLVLSLPWLVTGVLRPAGMPGDTAAVGAFAARADTPFGALGSLLLLGGAWNRETVPAGYGAPLTAAVWLLVVLGALAAYTRWCRTEWAGGLALAAAAGFGCAAAGAVAAGPLRAAIGLWPGFAVLRDGQQYAAPLAVVVAVGLGLAVDRLLAPRPDAAGAALGIFAVLAPVVLLPGLAWGAGGRLRAVDYPGDWVRARAAVAADPVRGDILVLPWATHRSYPWNGGRRSLDAAPRYFDRRVVISDAVAVGGTVIPAEDPRARRLDPLIRSDGPLAVPLAREGVRYVFIDARDQAFDRLRQRLDGAEKLVDGPTATLYRLNGTFSVEEGGVPGWLVVITWFAVIAAIVWSFRRSIVTLITLTPR